MRRRLLFGKKPMPLENGIVDLSIFSSSAYPDILAEHSLLKILNRTVLIGKVTYANQLLLVAG
jgi:hypothetical protein